MYNPADFIEVTEGRICPTFKPSALDKNECFDGVKMHAGTVSVHEGDVLSVLRVIGVLLLCRAGSDIIGIHQKRVKRANPPTF